METTSGKEKRKERLRREILDAASALFSQEGYEHVTMRGIAEKVEYSQSSIYFYFRDKTDILATLCEEVFAGLAEHFDAISAKEKDPLACLTKASHSAVTYWLEHPHHFRSVFLGPVHHDGVRTADVLARIGDPVFHRFAQMFHRCCHKSGKPDMNRPDPAALAWFSSLLGVTVFLILNGDQKWLNPGKVLDQTLTLLSQGLSLSNCPMKADYRT